MQELCLYRVMLYAYLGRFLPKLGGHGSSPVGHPFLYFFGIFEEIHRMCLCIFYPPPMTAPSEESPQPFYLTRTESIIVEALKEGPKTDLELEETIDRAKDFSQDYIKVMIFKINKKRKMIDYFMQNGQKKYRLIESAANVEYQILESIGEALDELVSVKLLVCDTCAFKANVDMREKVKRNYMIGAIILGIMLFAL